MRSVSKCGSLLALLCGTSGCYSVMNGWLDPTVLGTFDRTATTEIRTSLTLEDAPTGIPGAVAPTPEDLKVQVREYPITAGDTLEIEINELRQRLAPYQAQVQVAAPGYVNLPVVGRVQAAESTVPEFEDRLRRALHEKNILVEPEVTVNPLFLQKATYSIFGVGVSAANNAPLRAGTFPIRRPDLRLLEAINQVGGLNEFVTDVFIFRYDEPAGVSNTGEAESTGGPADTDAAGGRAAAPRKVSQADREAVFGRFESSADSRAAPAVGQSAPEEPPSAKPTAERELVESLLAPEPEPAPKAAPEPVREESRAILEALEADPTQPFVWVNDEFVPNPAYRGSARAAAPVQGEAAAIDFATPAATWARLAGDTSFRILQIPAEALRTGDPMWNIFVRAGDVIRIVSGEIGIYYVMGQVNRVGAFAFNAEPITLKSAIAIAGGLSGLAWPDRCTIYRRIGQREQMIQVNLDRIFAGVDADFMIKRGDIINVGTHPFAPFLQRIRALSLPNIANNVGYGFTYARNYADIDSFAVRQNPHNRPDRFPNLFP
ncbi:MAG: polysaccharide biosynthesis/export family protein [Planctomycetes bacterium]|nr:polysaccharide biosynthesis/export family protein [Planctomycetota bacterium]